MSAFVHTTFLTENVLRPNYDCPYPTFEPERVDDVLEDIEPDQEPGVIEAYLSTGDNALTYAYYFNEDEDLHDAEEIDATCYREWIEEQDHDDNFPPVTFD